MPISQLESQIMNYSKQYCQYSISSTYTTNLSNLVQSNKIFSESSGVNGFRRFFVGLNLIIEYLGNTLDVTSIVLCRDLQAVYHILGQ